MLRLSGVLCRALLSHLEREAELGEAACRQGPSARVLNASRTISRTIVSTIRPAR
jgi:hypothetical protein